MNYGFFGCSHTAGMPQLDWFSYVEVLADKHPEHNFYNFAVGGSSLSFSIYLPTLVKKYYNLDYKILQVTGTCRFTSLIEFNVKDFMVQKTDNYFHLSSDVRKHYVQTITPANINGLWTAEPKKTKWAKQYYNKANPDMLDQEYIALYHTYKNNFDYNFLHLEDAFSLGADSVADSLDKNTYMQYMFDHGKHFNEEGHRYVADFIKERYKI